MTTWRDYALCAETDPELFFPPLGVSSIPARRVCARCEVRAECLADAIEHPDQYGIRAGLTARQIQKLARRRPEQDLAEAS